MNRKETVTLNEILDEIMLQESEPSHEALLRWCKQYPEHQQALASFFASWAVQKEQTEQPVIDEARVASRMVSHALNLIYHQPQQASQDDRLSKMVTAAGRSRDALMAECSLDDSLLAKLDRHLILFTSIPRKCISNLAQALNRTADDIARALTGNPIPLASHKAKRKPVLRQETFLAAVASSDLPSDAKEEWKRVASIENLA